MKFDGYVSIRERHEVFQRGGAWYGDGGGKYPDKVQEQWRVEFSGLPLCEDLAVYLDTEAQAALWTPGKRVSITIEVVGE